MPTIMKATRKAEDPQFAYSNAAQGYPPNPGAPIPPLQSLAGGNSYDNVGMFGSNNTFRGAGQQGMNMGGGNPERPRGTAIRSYASPYGNPELEYVYLGSPKTPFLTPGFSNNPSHALQPAPGNAFVEQQPTGYLAPQGQFQAPLQAAQRYSGGVMEPKPQVQVPVPAQGLYDMPTTPEYDDIWANLEAVLLAQETTQQYAAAHGGVGMVAAFGFDPHAMVSSPSHSGVATSSDGSAGADYKAWAALSHAQTSNHAFPDGDFSSTSTGVTSTGLPPRPARQTSNHAFPDGDFSSTSTGVTSTGLPPRPARQTSNHALYSPLNELPDNPPMDMMVMDDSVSSTENNPSEPGYGYSAQNTGDATRQRSSRPENDFRDPQPSPELYNDFAQLMSPGLVGIENLGEPCWAVQLLNLCAAAIASQNISRTQHLMWVLNDLASAQGDVNQRFAAYGLKALFCRVTDDMEAAATFSRPRHNEQEISFGSDRVHRALVRFHDYVPWHQNCYTTSSQTLLEVCAGKSRLHLIDVGAGKGIEWPIFIDALASRAGGPPSILRITMIRDLRREEHNLRYAKSVNSDAADFMTRLVKFASALGLHVEVNMIMKALECVTREDLRLRNGEILAVVCQFRLHRLMEVVPERVSSNARMVAPGLSPRDEFMEFIFRLNPHVFILSDNNSDHCAQDFLARFQSVAAFWWNFYESLDMGYNGRDAEERQIIEFEAGSLMLNQVACEGIARIERNDTYRNWARRVRRAGFVAKDLSDDTRKACQTLVQNHSEFWDVTFDEPNMVGLRWRKHDATFTSVWTTPGSCSKPACKCSMLHN